MTYAELPKLKKNSVSTTLSSGITDSAVTIPVTELSVFYDADSNLIAQGIVIGYDSSNPEHSEEITITGASGTSGAGNLTGATRGVNADGSIGAARAWDSGTNIAVMFSTGIYEQIRENQMDHESTKVDKPAYLPIWSDYDQSTITGVTGGYEGGVLAPNGKIYCVPNTATSVLIIDPATDTA